MGEGGWVSWRLWKAFFVLCSSKVKMVLARLRVEKKLEVELDRAAEILFCFVLCVCVYRSLCTAAAGDLTL